MNLSDLTALDGAGLPDTDGKTVLVVNVASKCGLTPQYEGLERLQKRFGGDSFTVLGVPCNQFMGQEPGTPKKSPSSVRPPMACRSRLPRRLM